MPPNHLTIAFIPVLDCATLVAAVEKGFTATEGLQVSLVREVSWSDVSNGINAGRFDAAHLPAPLTIAASLGVSDLMIPVVAPISLGLGGSAITVSNTLWQQMQIHGAQLGADPALQGKALQRAITQRVHTQATALTFAIEHTFSSDYYQLRYWLASCGIDPDRDVKMAVMSPLALVDALRNQQIDGFCGSEPWNSLAVEAGVGIIAATTSAIWRLSPEKILACRAEWAQRHSEQTARLIRALYRAALWCEQTEHHDELATLLSQQQFIDAPAQIINRTLSNQVRYAANTELVKVPEYFVSARHTATFPWASHALWFYSQMIRWHQATASSQAQQLARAAYRPDLYRHALLNTDAQLPMTDFKTELTTDNSFSLDTGDDSLSFAAEGFFDGKVFEPTAVDEYIKSFN